MSKIKRLQKAIVSFIESYKNDMTFAENSLFVRLETLEAVKKNDLTIKAIENVSMQQSSVQNKMIQTFLQKCIEAKLPPAIIKLYQDDKKVVPGLNMEVTNTGNVGTGMFIQKLKVTLYNEILGVAEISSKLEGNKILSTMKERITVTTK